MEKHFEAQIHIPFLTLHEALISGIYRDRFPAKLRDRRVLYVRGYLLLHLQPASQQPFLLPVVPLVGFKSQNKWSEGGDTAAMSYNLASDEYMASAVKCC